MRYLALLFLSACAVGLVACGGGGGGGGSWDEDDDVISDDGASSMVSVPAGEGKVGIKHPKIIAINKKLKIPRKRRAASKFRVKTFKSFRIDKYEVTFGNYYKFMETLDEETAKLYRPRHPMYKNFRHPFWRKGHYKSGYANYPVSGIPYTAAKAYAEWRGKRLPDEFEWEYAARGKEGLIFGAASDSYVPQKMAVSDNLDKEEPVAVNEDPNTLDVSPFGAIGMGGNVSEWCSSKQVREFPRIDPETGKYVKGVRDKYRLKAWRGPNFMSREYTQCLLSIQSYSDPTKRTDIKQKYSHTRGFRCAK